MLDIKKIKEDPASVKAGLKAKEVDCDAVVDKILELDVEIRALKTSTEGKTAEKNKDVSTDFKYGYSLPHTFALSSVFPEDIA